MRQPDKMQKETILQSPSFGPAIYTEMNRIAAVAGFLWTKNWAECNSGNISVNLTAMAENTLKGFPAVRPDMPLPETSPALGGKIFYVTGSGTRMRDIAKAPLDFGCIMRISPQGTTFDILSGADIKPTSELPSHLAIHNFLSARGSRNRVVLHTHPTELIALTHHPAFLDGQTLTRVLWSMMPETRIIVPKGLGVVPYMLPGTLELARETIQHLEKHDTVLWEKHGILTAGLDIEQCFDGIDALAKSAQIYLMACSTGCKPQGLTEKQLDELAGAFLLPPGNPSPATAPGEGSETRDRFSYTALENNNLPGGTP